jgi:hypothetical protein
MTEHKGFTRSTRSVLRPVVVLLPLGSAGIGVPSTIEPVPRQTPRSSAAGEEGFEPCKRAVGGDSPIARACREGGVRGAKATMKELITEGRTTGLRYGCDDCHLDGTDFSRISPEAPDKLKNLLALVGRS